MNGARKLKTRNTSKKDDESDDEKEDESTADKCICMQAENSEPALNQSSSSKASTSSVLMVEGPKWNTSTRQLYENNLRSTTGPSTHDFNDSYLRERIPSLSESTSSDESCVYMYKGNDDCTIGNDVNNHVNCSSPEMDYLEMDFDPGISNGHDSSPGSCDSESIGIKGVDHDLLEDECQPPSVNAVHAENHSPISALPLSSEISVPSTSTASTCKAERTESTCNVNEYKTQDSRSQEGAASNVYEEETSSSSTSVNQVLNRHVNDAYYHLKRSHLITVSCCIVHLSAALKRLVDHEEEHYQKLDTFLENLHFQNILNQASLPITDFLAEISIGFLTLSRIQGAIAETYDGTIISRFFSTFPPRNLNLSTWLDYWLKKGAVAVVSLNFHLSEKNIYDYVTPSWHYFFVHAVSPKGIMLFADADFPENDVEQLLTHHPCEIMMTKDYIMAQWSPKSDLRPLLNMPDPSWEQFNVLGQMANIVRQTATGKCEGETKVIKVPSRNDCGILLLMRSDNESVNELLIADEFPINTKSD